MCHVTLADVLPVVHDFFGHHKADNYDELITNFSMMGYGFR